MTLPAASERVAYRQPARSVPRRSEPSEAVTVASCATKSLLSESPAPSTFVAISGRSAARTARARSRAVRSSGATARSEEHTSELQSRLHLVCRLLLEKKKKQHIRHRIQIDGE